MKTFFISLLLSTSLFANVDLKNSSFKWTGSKVAEAHYGSVKLKSADLKLKEGAVLPGSTFVMDLNSLSAGDVKGDTAKKLIGHLKSGDFLEVEKYPTATLKVKEVQGKTVTADLTIKGETNPVTFDVMTEKKNMKGTLKFDRTKFNMKYNSGNYFKDLVAEKVIKDEVTVDFVIALK